MNKPHCVSYMHFCITALPSRVCFGISKSGLSFHFCRILTPSLRLYLFSDDDNYMTNEEIEVLTDALVTNSSLEKLEILRRITTEGWVILSYPTQSQFKVGVSDVGRQ
jgi:hypothetical protein